MKNTSSRSSAGLSRRAFISGVAALCVAAGGLCLAGCSSSDSDSGKQADSAADADAGKDAATDEPALSGHELNVYCGAGMTDAFTKLQEAFTKQTGCTVNATFANAAQIQTQITTTGEGDFFIAGSVEELEPVKDSVASQVDLVKHIPVLAVPADNPKEIAGLADLADCEILLIGDPESTPVGKIAKKALTEAGLWEDLNASGAITTTTTAPQIATALANGEGDAGIVWKENVNNDGAAIVETSDLDAYVKVIPAAQLTSCADEDAAAAFVDFLQTDEAWDIWAEFGYEKA